MCVCVCDYCISDLNAIARSSGIASGKIPPGLLPKFVMFSMPMCSYGLSALVNNFLLCAKMGIPASLIILNCNFNLHCSLTSE